MVGLRLNPTPEGRIERRGAGRLDRNIGKEAYGQAQWGTGGAPARAFAPRESVLTDLIALIAFTEY
jgi:hypothetical protein